MKFSLFAIALLFTLPALADDWMCTAYCTRFTYVDYEGHRLQRYRGAASLEGPTSASAEEALEALRGLCRRRTPSAFDVTVDYEVYVGYLSGIPFIHKDTVSATTDNSCYRR